MRSGDRALPDMGGVLGGLPHPVEREIRRRENPGYYGGALFPKLFIPEENGEESS